MTQPFLTLIRSGDIRLRLVCTSASRGLALIVSALRNICKVECMYTGETDISWISAAYLQIHRATGKRISKISRSTTSSHPVDYLLILLIKYLGQLSIINLYKLCVKTREFHEINYEHIPSFLLYIREFLLTPHRLSLENYQCMKNISIFF